MRHEDSDNWKRIAAAAAAVLLGSTTSVGVAEAGGYTLKLASDVPAMKGLQAQLPKWGPGDVPTLVHEMTDRNRKSYLRVVRWEDGALQEDLVHAAHRSRLQSLGAGQDRADTDATWYDSGNFFFLRAVAGQAKLHTFDIQAREVPGIVGRIEEVAVDAKNHVIFAAMEDSEGLDVFWMSDGDISGKQVRVSRNSDDVEHNLTIVAERDVMYFIAASRERTRLATAKLDGSSSTEPSGQGALAKYELLSMSAVPGQDTLVLYARTKNDHYVLLEVSGAGGGSIAVKELLSGAFLPSGIAPRPALSQAGRFVYYISADTSRHNPVMRLDRDTGKTEQIKLNSSGHQEVAAHDYKDSSGELVPWIAVVAVGDSSGEDVRNHLYLGPLGHWSDW